MLVSIAPAASKEKTQSYIDWFEYHSIKTKIIKCEDDPLEGVLILCGGADVGTKPKRDKFEKTLIDRAISENIPIFGICRGMQIVNWHLGGVVEDLINEIDHCPNIKVSMETGTHHLKSIHHEVHDNFGEEFITNSRHHQHCSILSSKLEPLFWTRDGTIEAASGENIFLVQWHPERKELRENKGASINLINWIKSKLR